MFVGLWNMILVSALEAIVITPIPRCAFHNNRSTQPNRLRMAVNYWYRAHLSGRILAILSGFLAACAALWAKSLDKVSKYAVEQGSELNPHLTLMIGYAFYVLINVLMWIVFGAALKKNGKCITTLALNTLSNFLFSALFGFAVFHEQVSVKWCFGITLLFGGVVCLLRS